MDNALSLEKMISTHVNMWCKTNDSVWLDTKTKNRFVDFLKGMLKYDPNYRTSAKEALRVALAL